MRIDILDVSTDALRFEEAIMMLKAWSSPSATPRYVSTCPVYTLMRARENARVGHALRNAAMVTADGMPIVWVQRRRGYPRAERVYGPDMMLALCGVTAGQGVSHFFYGGRPGVPQRLAARLRTLYPMLEIAGSYSPPFADPSPMPDPKVIAELNATGAHVIWVGLGSPKQDLWMAQYRPHLNAPLLVGVGAAFDFVSGAKRQAPMWMRRYALEWVFRLVHEPGRLWRRYVIYNPRFLWQITREGPRLQGQTDMVRSRRSVEAQEETNLPR